MLPNRVIEGILVAIAIAVLALNATCKLAAKMVINRVEARKKGNGVSDSTPTSQTPCLAHSSLPAPWSVEGEVALQLDSWTRYHLSSSEEWAPLFPEGGVIHVGPSHTPYTVAMMHQLRCLDALREQLSRPRLERDVEPTRHCMNYLRQVIMCRGDLVVDWYQYVHKINSLNRHAVRRCKDWTAVYEKVWDNQKEHSAWLKSRANSTNLTLV
ncbi:hypothetical protein C8Q74DRAFT_1304876 [Fomes fomentarius]|nr:hypothetical protein C8Q74DRAFT_1304876 [Fomes fomentarius]